MNITVAEKEYAHRFDAHVNAVTLLQLFQRQFCCSAPSFLGLGGRKKNKRVRLALRKGSHQN